MSDPFFRRFPEYKAGGTYSTSDPRSYFNAQQLPDLNPGSFFLPVLPQPSVKGDL